MKCVSILIAIILFASCKKNIIDNMSSVGKIYSIEGQIFESSGSPVPVSNYTISFYQKVNSGLLGGVAGLDTTVKTGDDGRFIFQYDPGKNFGLLQGGTNLNDIHLAGVDKVKYKNIYPEWRPISSAVNVNLNTLYLFKKIETLVRKVQFENSLNLGDSLEVITTDSSGASYKTLYGPIASGTLLTVDTVKNCKISQFNLLTREYILLGDLKNPSYEKDFGIILTPGDELYREFLMTY